MRIYVTSVFVTDQSKALTFYTDVLGFVVKHNIPMGEFSWLTVVGPGELDGTELLLEPDQHSAVGPFKTALRRDGIPNASFMVDDVRSEFVRLVGRGVRFTQRPTEQGPVTTAVFDDTVGNLIQIVSDTSS
jgi:catechol 2,3-dioxygenase-like lactoylglutathione lyase family enzyme